MTAVAIKMKIITSDKLTKSHRRDVVYVTR